VLYLAAVIGLSFVAPPLAVAAMAALSALALSYVSLPPIHSLAIVAEEDWALFLAYFLAATVIGTLVAHLRSREAAIAEREKAKTLLLEAAQRLSAADSPEAAAAVAAELVEDHCGLPAAVILGEPELRAWGGAAGSVDEAELRVAAYALGAAQACGAGTGTLDSARLRYLPALAADGSGERAAAVIGVAPPRADGSGRDPAAVLPEDRLILSLGRTLALSIERLRSEAGRREALVMLESERLGAILLDSVSHELRTPLTTIAGSLSSLAEGDLDADPAARREVAANALGAAWELEAVVDDLLSLSRIEAGMLRLSRRWADLPEIAEAAVARAGGELRGRPFVEEVEDEERGAFVDFALVARLAANLLRNAARYSPPEAPIEFSVGVRGGSLAIAVRDRGPGLPEDELDSVFEKFARGRGASGAGLGLGLAICRGIALAHGGTVEARNVEAGGLEILALLPCAEGAGR